MGNDITHSQGSVDTGTQISAFLVLGIVFIILGITLGITNQSYFTFIAIGIVFLVISSSNNQSKVIEENSIDQIKTK